MPVKGILDRNEEPSVNPNGTDTNRAIPIQADNEVERLTVAKPRATAHAQDAAVCCIGGVGEAIRQVRWRGKVPAGGDAAFGHAPPENAAPRAIALLDVIKISGILPVESEETFTQPIYASNAITTCTISKDGDILPRNRHYSRDEEPVSFFTARCESRSESHQ